MKKMKALLWLTAIFLIVAFLCLVNYDYLKVPIYRKGPEPAPLYLLCITSFFLYVILSILLIFVIRNLKKKKE